MSRFANRDAVERFSLGACECDNAPHTEDWIDLRTELSGLELATMEGSDLTSRLLIIAVAWNLTDGGEVAPLDADHLSRLSLPTLNTIATWWSERAERFALPNGSGAPSRNGSRASASPIPMTRKRH